MELKSKSQPYTVELWLCDNCAYPNVIEDGGFYPEGSYIGDHHPAGYRIECGICCHDAFIKIPFKPTDDGLAVWKRGRV